MRTALSRRWSAIALASVLVWLTVVPFAAGSAVRPVDGRVLRGFDPPDQPWLAGHRGIDLRAGPGDPVRAVADGRIGFAGKVGGKPVVTVVHGRLRTTYEPVTATVSAGDRVPAGTVIGHLAEGHDCGGSAPACLHLGLLRGDVYLDPMLLFADPEIRLLSAADAAAITRGT
ncbi:MAG: M23 family metallopeptidase [Propionicimonas sp.]